jgi:hypothetical protein
MYASTHIKGAYLGGGGMVDCCPFKSLQGFEVFLAGLLLSWQSPDWVRATISRFEIAKSIV